MILVLGSCLAVIVWKEKNYLQSLALQTPVPGTAFSHYRLESLLQNAEQFFQQLSTLRVHFYFNGP